MITAAGWILTTALLSTDPAANRYFTNRIENINTPQECEQHAKNWWKLVWAKFPNKTANDPTFSTTCVNVNHGRTWTWVIKCDKDVCLTDKYYPV